MEDDSLSATLPQITSVPPAPVIGGREQIREELSKEGIFSKCDVSRCKSDDINITIPFLFLLPSLC